MITYLQFHYSVEDCPSHSVFPLVEDYGSSFVLSVPSSDELQQDIPPTKGTITYH